MRTPGESDPYVAPRAPALAHPDGGGPKWRVEGGSLWVQDGADLPPVSLYGAAGNVGSGDWVKLAWISPALQRGRLVAHVVALAVLVALAMQARFELLESLGILLLVLLAADYLPRLIMSGRQPLRRIRVHYVSGGGKLLLKHAAQLLVLMALVFVAFYLLDRLAPILGIGQNQKIGLSHAGYFVMFTLIGILKWYSFPRLAEQSGDWFRMEGVHPLAIDALLKIQERSGPPAGNSSA